MGYKRIYVRVPLEGEAILSNSKRTIIKARAIDISQGGIAITAFSEAISKEEEYQITVLTESGMRIQLSAHLVRVDDAIAGFQAVQIDQNSQEIIKNLVFEYQTTPAFIRQLDEFNLLDQRIVDEEGNEIEVTFEKITRSTPPI